MPQEFRQRVQLEGCVLEIRFNYLTLQQHIGLQTRKTLSKSRAHETAAHETRQIWIWEFGGTAAVVAGGTSRGTRVFHPLETFLGFLLSFGIFNHHPSSQDLLWSFMPFAMILSASSTYGTTFIYARSLLVMTASFDFRVLIQ